MKKLSVFVLCILMLFAAGCGTGNPNLSGDENKDYGGNSPQKCDIAPVDAYNRTADYLCDTTVSVNNPALGTDWVNMGLIKGGYTYTPEGYIDAYYNAFADDLDAKNGVLDDTKYTEYSRSVLMLNLMEKDPADVNGYNLLYPLADYNATISQGVNGAIWALIALGCGNYVLPDIGAETPASAELYLQNVLSAQSEDGGFSLDGTAGDIDITAMALQAFSYYQSYDGVPEATDKALSFLSAAEAEDGTFTGMGSKEPTCESCAQVMMALGTLGINIEDERFVRDGITVYDGLMRFCMDNGSFMHSLEEGEMNPMATYQAFCALAWIIKN